MIIVESDGVKIKPVGLDDQKKNYVRSDSGDSEHVQTDGEWSVRTDETKIDNVDTDVVKNIMSKWTGKRMTCVQLDDWNPAASNPTK